MYYITVVPCLSSNVPPGGGARVLNSAGRHTRYKIVACDGSYSVVQMGVVVFKRNRGL